MTKTIKVGNHLYEGVTSPEVIDFQKMGIPTGIQIKNYVADTRPNLPKIYKETHFKNWKEQLAQQGYYELLWLGKKGKVTIVQTDYANQTVVGALFIPHETCLEHFHSRKLDRKMKTRARHLLHTILVGLRKDHKDGLLHKLNNRLWFAQIIKNGQPLKTWADLKEHEASNKITHYFNLLQAKERK